MIVFVIAHNVDHMWKTIMTALEEIVIAVATIIWSHDAIRITLCDIAGHTDVATQNQDFGTLIIVKVQVSKFQMYITD